MRLPVARGSMPYSAVIQPLPDRAFSLGVGSGISAFHFIATATAESKRAGVSGAATDRDASAIHTQAFYVVGPESPTL